MNFSLYQSRGFSKLFFCDESPVNALSLKNYNFLNILTSISMKFLMDISLQEESDALPVALGVVAATGLGLFTFTEVWLLRFCFLNFYNL